jgi:heme-degrading monooxygenase HmoA
MILESAMLSVRPGESAAFQDSLVKARPLIASSKGFKGIEVRPCIEAPGRYLLLVWWETLADHTEGFRGSDRYPKWKALLHHFYEPFPTVEHFGDSIV